MKGDDLVIRYAMKGQSTNDLVHSSSYAKIQPSATSSSNDSFASRQSLNQNRQFVRGYSDSRLSAQRNTYQRARVYDKNESTSYYERGNRQGTQGSASVESSQGASRYERGNRQGTQSSTPDSSSIGGYGRNRQSGYGRISEAPTRAPQFPTRRMGI